MKSFEAFKPDSLNTAHTTRPVQVRLHGPRRSDRRLTTMCEASRVQHNRLILWRTVKPGLRSPPPPAINRRLPGRPQQDHQGRLAPREHFGPETCTRPCKSPCRIRILFISRASHMRSVHRPRTRTQCLRPAPPRIRTQRHSFCAHFPTLLQPRAGRHPS